MLCNKCKKEIDNKLKKCPYCGEYVDYTEENSMFDEFRDGMVFKSNNIKSVSPSVFEKEVPSLSSSILNDEREDKKVGGLNRFVLGFLIALIIIGATCTAMYYAYNHFIGNSSAEYNKSIANLNTDIVKTNDDIVTLFKKTPDNIASSEIQSGIPNAIDSFNEIGNKFYSVSTPSVFSSQHKKLEDAIKLNKLIYQQLEIILSNPLDPNIQKNIEILKQYIDECMNNYSSIKIGDNNFTLPNEIISLPTKIEPWVKQKKSEYSQITSLLDSFSVYFDSMSKIILSYDGSRVDLVQAVKAARTDRKSWDQLYNLIDKSENTVKNVKSDYLKLSVPSYLKTFNKEFAPIIDDSLTYYNKLRFAVQTESSYKMTGLTPENILKKSSEFDVLYQDAEKLNTSTMMNYQKFASSLTAQKDKYLNPDFVMSLKSGK